MLNFWFVVLACVLISQATCVDKLTMCVVSNFERGNVIDTHCTKLLSSDESRVHCIDSPDRLTCMHMMKMGVVDFGVFKAEDLLLSSYMDLKEELVVTDELRKNTDNEKNEYDMVALVSNSIQINSLSDLRETRLCHPGFDEKDELYNWSEIYAEYFEETVIPEQCDPDLSVFENKLKSSSDFFSASCKAGTWSPDYMLDAKLKSRYSNLCETCIDPVQCSTRDLYWGRSGALLCLTDCRGDVSWTRLEDVNSHFKDPQYTLRCQNVSFLCPDGSKMPLNTVNPCVWLSRPWPVIAARKQVGENVASLMSYMMNETKNMYIPEKWENSLRVILGYSSNKPIIERPIQSFHKYLEGIPGFLKANSIATCKGSGDDRTVIICVESKRALEKCDTMAHVAHSFSIDPDFKCILDENCVNSVVNNRSDVLIIGTERLHSVIRDHNLTTILYQTTDDYANLRHSSIVILRNSNIKTVDDFQGKKACFTSVDGLGWNSFARVLKNKGLLQNECNNTDEMVNYFGNICVIQPAENVNIRWCLEDAIDGEYNFPLSHDVVESEAIRCIVEGGGDVAFVDSSSIKRSINMNNDTWAKGVKLSHFKIINPNKTFHEGYVNWASYGQILVNPNITEARREEITSAFLLLNTLFGNGGSQVNKLSPIFKLFSPGSEEADVLFESSAGQLESSSQFNKRGEVKPNNYEDYVQKTALSCKNKPHPKQEKSMSNMISYIPSILYVLEVIVLVKLVY